MLIGVYGSLRKGEFNHTAAELGDPILTKRIEGFHMLDLRPVGAEFPVIIRGTSSIVAEFYEISFELFLQIYSMEIGAGYLSEIIHVPELHANATIFYMEPNIAFDSLPIVESGDWIKHLETYP